MDRNAGSQRQQHRSSIEHRAKKTKAVEYFFRFPVIHATRIATIHQPFLTCLQETEMSAILDLRTAPHKPAKRKNGTGIDTKLNAMFDQVREEARKVPAGKRAGIRGQARFSLAHHHSNHNPNSPCPEPAAASPLITRGLPRHTRIETLVAQRLILVQRQPDVVHRRGVKFAAKQVAIRLAPRRISGTERQIHFMRHQPRVEPA